MKKLAILGAIAVLATTFIAPVASAKTSSSSMRVSIEPNGKARVDGTISSISGNTLSVSSWGGTWSVDVSAAKFLRNPQASSSLSQFQNGDAITVRGTMNSSTTLSLKATEIRNDSIKFLGNASVGTISNISSSSQNFTLTTASGKAYSVTAGTSTKIFVNGKKNPGSFANLIQGMRAQVKGLLNMVQNTISATSIVAGVKK